MKATLDLIYEGQTWNLNIVPENINEESFSLPITERQKIDFESAGIPVYEMDED